MDRPVIINILLKPKESKLDSVFKDCVSMLFLLICVYISEYSPVWQVITIIITILVTMVLTSKYLKTNTDKFCSLEDAIHELERLNAHVAEGTYTVKTTERLA